MNASTFIVTKTLVSDKHSLINNLSTVHFTNLHALTHNTKSQNIFNGNIKLYSI